MGYRYHIAMSLLAFDSEGPISPTFGPASFIVSCKSENIVATSLEDCNSADECFPLPHPDIGDEAEWTTNKRMDLKTLDMMAVYPLFALEGGQKYLPIMNEIVVSSCAVDTAGKISRPEVVGVLFDHREVCSMQRSLGNRGLDDRAQSWYGFMKQFAEMNKLPFVEIPAHHASSFSSVDMMEKIQPLVNREDLNGFKNPNHRTPVSISKDMPDSRFIYHALPYIHQYHSDYRFTEADLQRFGLM